MLLKSVNILELRILSLFRKKINDLVVPSNFVVATIDAVSLISNIPIELVTDIISQNWELVANQNLIEKGFFLGYD